MREIIDEFFKWLDTRDIVRTAQFFKDIAVIIAAIVGAWQGGKALKQWRLELKGKDQYKVARDISLKAIEVADRLHSVRMQFKWTEEMEEAYQSRRNNPDQIPQLQNPFSRNVTKLELAETGLQELSLLNWRAQILDLSISEHISEFRQIITDFWRSNDVLHILRERGFNDQIELERNQNILYGETDDEFGQRIESQKNQILETMKPYI